ncbi:MAG TPA: HAMP domain-containing sensor histidine kinase [Candidatus Krumholzibacteriaceae bacterium]|nr:HAMP domain-containing sensor histidine kinase [Candidatus Krumholzibacteriaceae bacterium]
MPGDEPDEEKCLTEEFERRLLEEMGDISSELAHDLRSPLQTIQNAIFLLERSPENPMFYTMIRESLKQTTQILDSFRDFYKGHLLKMVDADIVKAYELGISELEVPDDVELTLEADEIERFRMDPVKVALVFRKLIKNAVEAMPGGGVVRVGIEDRGDHVEVRISDTGSGIPEEVVKVIYKPFMAKRKGGRGLGVPACRRIVEAHGGTIGFETSLGEGTTFTFTIPKG